MMEARRTKTQRTEGALFSEKSPHRRAFFCCRPAEEPPSKGFSAGICPVCKPDAVFISRDSRDFLVRHVDGLKPSGQLSYLDHT